MGAIAFERSSSTVAVHNPLQGFALQEQLVEVRRDPILGDTSVLNRFQQTKTGFFGENDRAFIAQLVAKSAANCIFCGERLGAATARYPEEFIPGGRLSRGQATLLPNLFALGAHHPVIVLSRAHFLELAEFTPGLIADGFGAAREFIDRAHRRTPDAVFTTIGANYLLPAGASQIHPHLQMLVTPVAFTHHERLLRACRAHHERHGTSCLDDLAREERRLGLRFVARRGGWSWLAAYAPRGCNEVLAVHETEQDVTALAEEDVQALAAGISRVLGYYGGLGLLSFNYALFSVHREAPAPGFRCCLRVISRQNLSPAYRNDDYFLQKLLDSDVIATVPEDLAERLRAVF